MTSTEFPSFAGSCRSCGASVIWAVTENGRRMPVDAEPAGGGNLRLFEREGQPPLAVKDVKEGETILWSENERHLSHFAACPEAREWRKR